MHISGLMAATAPRRVGLRRAGVIVALAIAYLLHHDDRRLCTALPAAPQAARDRAHHLGPCEFNPATLSFAGEPDRADDCLMRSATSQRNLGPYLEFSRRRLQRVGQTAGLPDRARWRGSSASSASSGISPRSCGSRCPARATTTRTRRRRAIRDSRHQRADFRRPAVSPRHRRAPLINSLGQPLPRRLGNRPCLHQPRGGKCSGASSACPGAP